MIKIGLIGEDPNDTISIRNLLAKLYEDLAFVPLIKNKRGYQLDNANTCKALRIEFDDRKPDLVLFVRDADAIVTESQKIEVKKSWFMKLLPAVDGKGILLLNIYELEALILADIEAFNDSFKTNIKFSGNVEFQKEPKEFLKGKTFKLAKRYSESEAPSLFAKMNPQNVSSRCNYFRDFLHAFETQVKLLREAQC